MHLGQCLNFPSHTFAVFSDRKFNLTRMHSSMMRTARSSSHQLGGVCLSACWDTPPRCGPRDPPGVGLDSLPLGVGLETPLGVGLETPQARPFKLPLGCGPENLRGMLGYTPPRDLQGMLGYRMPCMLGCSPPVNRMTDRHV